MIKRILFVVAIIVVFFVCDYITIEEIIGRYQTIYPYGTETLVLNPDGTFEQSIDLNDRRLSR